MTAATASSNTIKPTAFQARVLAVPEDCDLFLGGGRGGGKTFTLLLLALRHVEQHGPNARVLIVRRDFPAMRDLEMEARHLFHAAYGADVTFNAQDHVFRFANGATVALDQIDSVAAFHKYQGKSFSLVIADEAGQYPQPEPLDMLRSTLRSKANIPVRMVLSANPGSSGHVWLQQRHVAGRSPWVPYTESRSGRQFVTCPSTFADNPHLSGDYPSQLAAATTDNGLRAAWIDGDWNIQAGSFFGQVFDTARNVIPPWEALPGESAPLSESDRERAFHGLRPLAYDWRFFVALDHGSAAPCVAILMAESPGAEHEGRYFPRGSFIAFDEVVFVEHDSLSKGLQLTVPEMAGRVVSVCRTWGMSPEGVADDACFARHGSGEGTLAGEYRRAGLRIKPAKKGDRLTGWERMRRLMLNASEPDVPGLFISEVCQYGLQTIPFLDRDPRRPEDLDTRAPDHWVDACRYGLGHEAPVVVTGIGFAWQG